MKNTPESGTYREKEKRLAALFILPSLAVFLVFMFYPLAYTLYLSFFSMEYGCAQHEICGFAELYPSAD